LISVFVDWLMPRFRERGKQEIENMILGKLPDLRDTQSGRDLIAIGVEQGIEQGIAKGSLIGAIQTCQKSIKPELRLQCGSSEKIDGVTDYHGCRTAGVASFSSCKTAVVFSEIIYLAKEPDIVLHTFATESPIGNALALSLDSSCQVHNSGPVYSRAG
jgi:hypothetical protein